MGFLDKDNTVAEVTKDTLGGGFTWDTGLYSVVIDSAYLDMSKGGAANVVIGFKTAEGKSLNQTIYVSSGTAKGQKNYYLDKQGAKQYLPGFTTMDDIALVTTGTGIGEVEQEDKMVEVYNYELGKKAPTTKSVFMGLIGQELTLGVQKVREFKNVKNEATGVYEPGDEIKEFNEIAKIFSEDGKTVVEMRAGSDALFVDKWAEKNPADYVKDKTKGKGGAKKPAGAAATATKSLFNK